MAEPSNAEPRPATQEALRRELLRLIVKNEAARRDQTKAPTK
jgi:hypothetical protein